MRRTDPVVALLCLAFVAGGAAGCSSDEPPSPGSGPSDPTSLAPPSAPGELPPAPEPATAVSPAVAPAGRVVPLGSLVEGVVVDGPTNTVAVALRNKRIALLDARTGRVRGNVNANGSARHLQLAEPGGPVLVPGEDSDLLVQLRLPDGVIVDSARVGRQPHDAAFDAASGRVVVADELGGSVSFVEGDRSVAQVPGPVQPGGLAVTGGRAGVVDVRGNLLYVYDVATAREIARIPVGAGATHAVAITDSLLVVADTRGSELYVVALDGVPRVLSRVPFAEGSPYGMAADPARKRLWVAASGDNVLARYEIGADGSLTRSEEVVPTVAQPNSVAVDPRNGTVFVGGATADGGVQIVSAPN